MSTNQENSSVVCWIEKVNFKLFDTRRADLKHVFAVVFNGCKLY